MMDIGPPPLLVPAFVGDVQLYEEAIKYVVNWPNPASCFCGVLEAQPDAKGNAGN